MSQHSSLHELQAHDFQQLCQQTIDEHAHQFHQRFSDLTNPLHTQALQLNIRSSLGEGFTRLNSFDDIMLSEQNFLFNRNIKMVEDCDMEMSFISIILGQDIYFETGTNNRFTQQAGFIYLGHARQGDSFQIVAEKNNHMHALSFCFNRQQLMQFFIELNRHDIADSLNDAQHSNLLRSAPLCASHIQLYRQLKTAHQHGALQAMAFRCHAQQLLLSLLNSLAQPSHPARILNKQDVHLLQQARKRLIMDLQNPPTISQLARDVGINQSKLKQGFRTLFDRTVLETLTEHRMHTAMDLLKCGDLSVAEVAAATGYENTSHFIATFKRSFRQTPGQVRKCH